MLQKAEKKCQINQEIGGCYKGMKILQNSVLIRSASFKCIVVRLGTVLMQVEKLREIALALCIRLEYTSFKKGIQKSFILFCIISCFTPTVKKRCKELCLENS